MRHHAIPTAIFILLLLTSSAGRFARAQTSPYGVAWWGTGGLGIGGNESVVGFLGASYHNRHVMLSLRTTVNKGPLGGDEINDVGLLYCFPMGTGRLHLSAGIGIGGIWGSFGVGPSGLYREGVPFTWGVPVELQAFWRPARFFGIGGYGFADVNSVQTILGAGLGVQCGRFW